MYSLVKAILIQVKDSTLDDLESALTDRIDLNVNEARVAKKILASERKRRSAKRMNDTQQRLAKWQRKAGGDGK